MNSNLKIYIKYVTIAATASLIFIYSFGLVFYKLGLFEKYSDLYILLCVAFVVYVLRVVHNKIDPVIERLVDSNKLKRC